MGLVSAIRITCVTYKEITPLVRDHIRRLGIRTFLTQQGRGVVRTEQEHLLGLFRRTVLDENPSDITRFYVARADEEAVLAYLARSCALDHPGRGEVYSDVVSISTATKEAVVGRLAVSSGKTGVILERDLVSICCIVQRGQYASIVRPFLELGISVPTITFGVGTGLRDKLGLLRIAIPAEKEVITMEVPAAEQRGVMDLLTAAGKLDQPGRGFIYAREVRKGIVNTRIFSGSAQHAASVEQMIYAIDQLKGDTEWRKRKAAPVQRGSSRRKHPSADLVLITVSCNEGQIERFVSAAMESGAAGATIGRSGADSADPAVGAAREYADMIVSRDQQERITAALSREGVFEEQVAGIIEVFPVNEICTYQEKR